MMGLLALPETPTPPPPIKSGKRIYAVLLTVLLVLVLVFALVIVFPLVTNPPSLGMTSSDWSGYSVASDLNDPQPQVTNVSASWTVPTVNVSTRDSFSAAWIGVGGQYDDTLIQIGTEHDSISGQPEYSAWYELLPGDSVAVDSLNVSAGDVITASMSLLNQDTNTWSIEIIDTTSGQSFKKSVIYASSMLSAEWIVERPTINNRITTLANFGQITFTDCKVTIGGKAGTISNFPSNRFTMQNRQNTELATVTATSNAGSSFIVNYLD